MTSEEWYSVEEIAKKLKIEQDEVFRFLLEAIIAGWRYQDTYIFDKSKVEKLLKRMKIDKKKAVVESLEKQITENENSIYQYGEVYTLLAKRLQDSRKSVFAQLNSIPESDSFWNKHYHWLDSFKYLKQPHSQDLENEEVLWAFITYSAKKYLKV
jgi:uncharacterized coiled-coil protein SlyX